MGKKREPVKSRMVFREHWILLTEGRVLCLLIIVAFEFWGSFIGIFFNGEAAVRCPFGRALCVGILDI